MFSYRHAFHAGNHADVLKHTTLIAIAQYLVQKDTPLSVIDTHAGAGLYRLDGDFAQTSGEAMEGIARMLSADATMPATSASETQRCSSSSQMASGYLIPTHASSGMREVAATTAASMRAVMEKCAPPRRTAATTSCW